MTKRKRPRAKAKLTNKQRAFIDQYMVDKNGAQAAIRAGYKARNAKEIAHQLMRKPLVAAGIEQGLQKLSEKAGVTAERIVEELGVIGLAPVKVSLNNVPLLSVKRQALVNLGDHLGMFKQKVEHTGADGGPIAVRDDLSNIERARRIAYILHKAAQAAAVDPEAE